MYHASGNRVQLFDVLQTMNTVQQFLTWADADPELKLLSQLRTVS